MSDAFLNNETPLTVLSGIRNVVHANGSIDVAVSYMQVSGWYALADSVTGVEPPRVRILVTDQFELTHPEALQLALKAGVQLRRFSGSRIYHPKVYLARDQNEHATGAVVGSANLSDSGVRDGIEGAVIVTDSQMLTNIGEWFDRLWTATENVVVVDQQFIRAYRSRWRAAARARVKMRRMRRKKLPGGGISPAGHPEDIEVLVDVCETIRVPIAILSMDQAANNIRNLSRLLIVLHNYPSIHKKALSELRLLGLVDGDQLTSVGVQCKRCKTTQSLARTWCRWVKTASEDSLLEINRNLATFRRAASAFWKLRLEVREFFFTHLEERDERSVLMAIELLCSASDAVRELRIEDLRALAPILANPWNLPKHLRNAIEEYHQNKGARSWRGDDRRTLLEAWSDV